MALKPVPPGKRTWLTLDGAIEAVKEEKVQEAFAAGCTSVREVAAFLGIKPSRAWRLVHKYGFVRSTAWTTPRPPRRRRRP